MITEKQARTGDSIVVAIIVANIALGVLWYWLLAIPWILCLYMYVQLMKMSEDLNSLRRLGEDRPTRIE